MTVPVFRFAPSPNGPLHLGHALSALLNADMAAESGGRMLVRIEDVDVTRARPEHERAILDDLGWLGIAYERPVRRQSEHAGDYAVALDKLADLGLVYRSSMSRTERSPLAMRWVPAARAWTGALISLASRKPNQVAPRKMSMVMSPRTM